MERSINSFVAQSQGIRQSTKTQATDQLVQSQSTKNTIQQSTQAKTIQQAANQCQDSIQQKSNGGNDLEQWLGEKTPERAKLLLGMGHVSNASLAVVNCLDNGLSQSLEQVSQLVLLRSGITRRSAGLGSGSNAAIGIKGANSAIALLEDLASLL